MATLNQTKAWILMIAGAALGSVILIEMGGGSASSSWSMIGTAVFTEAPLAIMWILAALGAGAWARPLLRPLSLGLPDREGLIWSIGVVTLLWLDSLLGTYGLLTVSWVAWGLILIPGAIGVLAIRNWHPPKMTDRFSTWVLAASMVPVAILLAASMSTPGWLWSTEFAGYDALSYHLQLPREWILLGRISETPHNAYGYLPNGVEAAFMHLGVLRGSGHHSAVACQLLSALLAGLAAYNTARVARAILPGDESNRLVPGLAATLLLLTPWVIVVGSLAYDETATMVCLSAALLLLLTHRDLPGKSALVIGLLLGGACLAKLSSGPLIVLPMAVCCAYLVPARRWFPTILLVAAGGLIIMAPWLIRNWMWTGNPTFPFLSTILGTGPWLSEQHDAWRSAHGGTSFGNALAALWNEFLRQGMGPAPAAEPWKMQWSIMPWLAMGGLVMILTRTGLKRETRSGTIALLLYGAATVLAWMFLTHAKARFLLPLAIPMSVLIAVAATMLSSSTGARRGVVLGTWILAIIPLWIFSGEGNGQPTWGIAKEYVLRGDYEKALMDQATDNQQRTEMLKLGTPALVINQLLPEDSRILLIGEAAPYHLDIGEFPGDRIVYNTVWSRGPLEELVSEGTAPFTWVDELRERGFTHVFVKPSMLDRWSRSGWLPEQLSAPRITALGRNLKAMHQFRDGSLLFRIPPAPGSVPTPQGEASDSLP